MAFVIGKYARLKAPISPSFSRGSSTAPPFFSAGFPFAAAPFMRSSRVGFAKYS